MQWRRDFPGSTCIQRDKPWTRLLGGVKGACIADVRATSAPYLLINSESVNNKRSWWKKGSPAGVEHTLEINLTYCLQCKLDDHTETERPSSTPQQVHGDTVKCLLPQSPCGLVGWSSRVCPVFLDKNNSFFNHVSCNPLKNTGRKQCKNPTHQIVLHFAFRKRIYACNPNNSPKFEIKGEMKKKSNHKLGVPFG